MKKLNFNGKFFGATLLFGLALYLVTYTYYREDPILDDNTKASLNLPFKLLEKLLPPTNIKMVMV